MIRAKKHLKRNIPSYISQFIEKTKGLGENLTTIRDTTNISAKAIIIYGISFEI